MSKDTSAEIEGVARTVRDVARTLTYTQRAELVRAVVRAVYDAVKFDAVSLSGMPIRVNEREDIGEVVNVTEEFYYATLRKAHPAN